MKMKKKKYYSIMLIPHENGTVKTFRVSYFVVRVLGVLLAVLIAGSAMFLLNQGKLISLASKAGTIEKENRELTRKNELILELAERVNTMETLYRQIGEMLGSSIPLATTAGEKGPIGKQTSGMLHGARLILEPGKMIPGASFYEKSQDAQRSRPSSWPLTVRGYITRRFSLLTERHMGIDIAVPRNTPVKATGDGVVEEARYDPIYGIYVLIDHGNRFSSFYAHNSRLCVSPGQRVSKDEVIAFSGSTGRSTAPHLHYELRKNNVPVDPELYLR